MKFVDEYRDPDAVRRCAAAIRALVRQPWSIMEVCGGQTHAIVRFGLDELLPSELTLIHGPGCPVCVTPVEMIDRALALAAYELFGLSGYARIDFRIDAAGNPFIIEANANPGIAHDSGLVAAAAEAGIDYDRLIARILMAAGLRTIAEMPSVRRLVAA